jgi:hypothetical protein
MSTFVNVKNLKRRGRRPTAKKETQSNPIFDRVLKPETTIKIVFDRFGEKTIEYKTITETSVRTTLSLCWQLAYNEYVVKDPDFVVNIGKYFEPVSGQKNTFKKVYPIPGFF